jgi:hypothetical protein
MISCSVSSCPVGKRHDHAGTVYKKKLSLKFGHYLTSQCPIVSCGKRSLDESYVVACDLSEASLPAVLAAQL